MTNRFIINKLGLVNFWHYDFEEFVLSDGKLLFRGSNGSGKSVTMQSFIPLLLDGNKSPHRLDPFGSRARKMENYLLDENTDEKTAYLYIEFKRRDLENYITIGMGMKAQKNRPLSSWYFIITDGRRIKEDFNLYRNAGGLIPLTKKQLENQISDGGFFTESQKKYMSKVNEYIFGFEDSERYEELINLLIQLRSPKLSKDFKPTEIYKILTESLRVLSEDDLRPMSESMENMDGMQNSLEEAKNALKAARNIKYHYDRYNKYCLYEKAMKYNNKNKEVLELENKIKNDINEYKKKEKELINLEEFITNKEKELKDAEIKYESLRDNDALKVKEELLNLEKEVLELKEIKNNKEKELDNKKDKERRKQIDLKKFKDNYDKYHYDICKTIDQLEDISREFAFKEGFLLKDEIVKDIENYDFQYIRICLDKYMSKIKEAKKVLSNLNDKQKKFDEILEKKEDIERSFENQKNELKKREELLLNTKEELKVNYVKWNDKNKLLKILKEDMQKIFLAIDKIEDSIFLGDYNAIVGDYYNKVKNDLNLKIEREMNFIKQIEEEIKAINEEVEELKKTKEIDPEREEGVLRNRKRLFENNIPFTTLYKAIDFNDKLSHKQKSAMESALVDMGIIDALIVDEKYKSDVLSFKEGQWDKYIFTKGSLMTHNISEYFIVDNEGLNGVQAESVLNVLEGIFLVDSNSMAYIDENGNYSLGALKGKANQEYDLKYIGASSRKKHREKLINEKIINIEDLKKKINQREILVMELQNNIKILESEKKDEPNNEDLKEALNLVYQCEREVKNLDNELLKEEEKLLKSREELKEIKKQVIEKTEGISINKKLEDFENANEAGEDYSKLLTDITIEHKDLKNASVQIRNTEEALEEFREIIDGLFYEISNAKNKIQNKNDKIQSLKEVLETSNLKEIEQQLEKCINIKNEYPRLIQEKSSKKGQIQEKLEHYKKTIEKNEMSLKEKNEVLSILEDIFIEEYSLEYVFPKEEGKITSLVNKAISMSDLRENKEREHYSGLLIESVSKNSAELREFALKQKTIFIKENIDEKLTNIHKGRARVDIICRIQGKEISFSELSKRIEQDIEHIKLLISNEERRIFEEILLNTISTKIKSKIYLSKSWVDKINTLMESMNTSSSLALSLKWVPKKAENEGQMNITELLDILERATTATESDMKKLASHFRDKVKMAIRSYEGTGEARNYHTIIKEVLDYRKWYEFKLFYTKKGEKKKELTNNKFFQFSGGEKAMCMYVPLFSAVYARYDNASKNCPRIISLDEAFAGVDEKNIRDMFRLLKDLNLDYILNSQILWGDYDTVDNLSICELIREENDDVVTVLRYHWNGIERKFLE